MWKNICCLKKDYFFIMKQNNHTHTNTHIHIYTHIYTHTFNTPIYICVCVCVCVCIYIYIYIYIPYKRKTFKNHSHFFMMIIFSADLIFFKMLDLHLQIHIYVYICIYIHIYCHPQTDCFIVLKEIPLAEWLMCCSEWLWTSVEPLYSLSD